MYVCSLHRCVRMCSVYTAATTTLYDKTVKTKRKKSISSLFNSRNNFFYCCFSLVSVFFSRFLFLMHREEFFVFFFGFGKRGTTWRASAHPLKEMHFTMDDSSNFFFALYLCRMSWRGPIKIKEKKRNCLRFAMLRFAHTKLFN